MDLIRLKRFEELCQPIVDFLNENYDPHTTVEVTQTGAKITQDLAGVSYDTVD